MVALLKKPSAPKLARTTMAKSSLRIIISPFSGANGEAERDRFPRLLRNVFQYHPEVEPLIMLYG
jgi:hypothetical protein